MIDTDAIRHLVEKVGVELTKQQTLALCDEIDRLRGEKQTPPQGKTVRAEIIVGVDIDGEWQGAGSSDYSDASATHAASTLHLKLNAPKFYKLTATLPVPAEVEVAAKVREVNDTLEGHE